MGKRCELCGAVGSTSRLVIENQPWQLCDLCCEGAVEACVAEGLVIHEEATK